MRPLLAEHVQGNDPLPLGPMAFAAQMAGRTFGLSHRMADQPSPAANSASNRVGTLAAANSPYSRCGASVHEPSIMRKGMKRPGDTSQAVNSRRDGLMPTVPALKVDDARSRRPNRAL